MNPKERQQRLYSEDAGLDVVHPDAAGIDVGNASHFVPVPPDREERPVREFVYWTADPRHMVEWPVTPPLELWKSTSPGKDASDRFNVVDLPGSAAAD
jgi:hypothetical protein